MSPISIGNINNINTTYVVKKRSQSEIGSLIKERESLQKELENLQKEITLSGGDDSKAVEVQIETLQSQISNINSQIVRLQAKESNENTKLLEHESALGKTKGFATEGKEEMELVGSFMDIEV